MFTNEAFYIFRVIAVFKLNRGGRIQGEGEGVKILIFREDSASKGGVLSPPPWQISVYAHVAVSKFLANHLPNSSNLGPSMLI